MKSILLIGLLSITLAGCANLNNPVSVAGVQAPEKQFVIDKTGPDDYPPYMAAEGNIYSCRFGIHHESVEEFSPPKVQLFAGLLMESLPWISSRKVVLERFDVYFNHRLKVIHQASGIGGAGIIQMWMVDTAMQNKDVFTFDKLIIDTNPDVERNPDKNHVGCDHAKEGEYDPQDISGGHSVIVTWLKFTVDALPYYFRTYYQFQPETKPEIAAGISDALKMTFKGIAPLVTK